MRRVLQGAGVLILLAAFLVPARAVAVESWALSSAEEFARGKLGGTAIDEEGRVGLSLRHETLWGPEQGIVWDVEPGTGSSGAFVALSSPGRVLRVGPGAEPEVWYEAEDEGLVAAVVSDARGGVYFGVSPTGLLLHAGAAGAPETVAETGARFVWALARAADGTVWIGTGLPGLVQRYDGESGLRTVFEAGDDPIRCITTLPDGGVLIGTGGQGRLIRIDKAGRPFVLLDAEESEIVAIERDSEGTIYALAASGSKQVGGAAARAPAASQTVRVVASPPSGKSANEGSGASEKAPADRPAPTRFKSAPGGALYRLGVDGGVRKIWRTSRDVPFGLARGPEGSLLVATGDQGRIYRLDERGRESVLLEIPSDQASTIVTAADGRVLVGGTTDARVERLGPGLRAEGAYVSPLLDANGVAAWGRLSWEVDRPRGADVRVKVRAGNTAEPDGTWTDWMPLNGPGARGVRCELPPTRFFQARVDMSPSRHGESPFLRRLELFYRRHNRAPVITQFDVQSAGVVWTRNPTPTARPTGPLVTDDPVARKTVRGLQPVVASKPVRRSYELGARTLTWLAEDPDKDSLSFSLEIRREGTSPWLPIAREIDEGFYSFDARGLPDGLYRARLTVEDARANPRGTSYTDQRVSPAFKIDNTRPAVGRPEFRLAGGIVEVEFVASDTGGNVATVEVAVDGGPWQPLDPLDGVADSPEERYQMVLEPPGAPPPETRSLRVRVTDASGNLGGDAWALDEGGDGRTDRGR